MDDSLNWNEHAMYVRAKVSRTNFALAMAKRLLPEHIKGMVYNSLFRCHLEYCLPIWGNCAATHKRGFLNMQKRAVRNISLSKYNSHTEPLFKKFRILKFEDLYKVNCATFMFNLSMGTHPPLYVS